MSSSSGGDLWAIKSGFSSQMLLTLFVSPAPQALEAPIIDDIRNVLLVVHCDDVCYVPQEENGVIHYLATFVLSQFSDFIWFDSVPKFLGIFEKADLGL
ncbi:hypothetical protein TIFTF001_016302 [Ficus carica]|uniref:Reverse transcriptase n=1 Tax=Ficus carica TaxID=3494 RepID=A0AA88AND4_FICCA|nr:hypothetical protein TIFTF001_016302 [Ficus carica]